MTNPFAQKPQAQLGYSLHRLAESCVLRIEQSSLSWRNAQELKSLLHEYLTGPLVLDLSEVEFMDTAGLAAILAAARRNPQQAPIALARVQTSIEHLLAEMNVSSRMLVCASPEQAAGQLGVRRSA